MSAISFGMALCPRGLLRSSYFLLSCIHVRFLPGLRLGNFQIVFLGLLFFLLCLSPPVVRVPASMRILMLSLFTL